MRKHRIWIVGLLSVLMTFGILTIKTQALTFDELPQVQESDHWIISIKEATNDTRIEKPDPKKFDTYELDIQNKAGQLGSVIVRAYRDEAQTNVRYGLAVLDEQRSEELTKLDGKAVYSAMSVTEKAKKIEVDVLWTSGEEGDRPYKETFVFTH
ncbi:hypothetical protein [Alkalicoccobacillus murimartini]|uniref:DUF5067 domain-containing protein n=1 Tax=Alkalicoccobacillus murimartini TaxID=171685 RepID=A0ABT9YK87_9BACI|nr:hypothetical protein [Alkalicoccobacillus murimartini]MDQ0207627.1 hypothetical protein [Alkalicoccobacillus murimartini]